MEGDGVEITIGADGHGASVTLFTGIIGLLEQDHGDRLVTQADLDKFVGMATEIEAAYIALPKKDSKS